MEKWIMTHSRSWWIGVGQIALGLALGVSGNVGALSGLHGFLSDVSGGGSPYAFIMAGFALITVRSAIK